jgi:hypothetical protein
MTIDSYLNQFILYLILVTSVIVAATVLIFIWRDKNFAIAMVFVESMMFIVLATWGKSLAVSAFVKMKNLELQFQLGDVTTDFGEALLGIAVTGLFAIVMMLIRHHYEIRRLAG